MKERESVLILFTLIFAVALYGVKVLKGPQIDILGRGAYADKTRIPLYIKFLGLTVLISGLLGYIVTKEVSFSLKYGGLNLLVGAIAGVNLIIYRSKGKTSKKNDWLT
jgi:hypothetical protein